MKAQLVVDGDLDELLELLNQLRAVRNGTDVEDTPPRHPDRPDDDAPLEIWVSYAESRGDRAASRRSKVDLIARHGGG